MKKQKLSVSILPHLVSHTPFRTPSLSALATFSSHIRWGILDFGLTLKLNDEKNRGYPFLSSFIWPRSLSSRLHLSWLLQHSVHTKGKRFWILAWLYNEAMCHEICHSAYIELKRISSNRHYLTEEATKTHVTSWTLETSATQPIIQSLQTLPNSAACLIFRTRRAQHCTPLLRRLH